MNDKPIFTYQTRIDTTSEQDEGLSAYAELYGRVERSLFAAIQAGGDFSKLKPEFMRRFGITARQYNAIAINLKGKITSVKNRRSGLITEIKTRINKARKIVANLEKKAPGSNKLQQKKRRLHNMEGRLQALERDQAENAVRICFGSKKLFRAQFALEANGYASLEEWRQDWREARSREFYVIGSKDETAGCQGCVATRQPNGAISLRLRLPDAIGKYICFQNLRFPYGQEVIDSALLTGSAISYRFRRDDKGWRVFVSTVCQAPPLITSRLAGAIGVDINADHLATAEIDRFGNLVGTKKIGCVTYGKSIERRQAVIGEAVKQVVDMAEAARKPVVIEKLDFDKRKAELEKEPAARARMLSSLAYSQVQQMLRAACFRAGVEVIGVNPAYTSTIGAVNFAQRYGISVHQGAALAIARRGLGFSESPTAPIGIVPVGNGGHVTFPLPVRNRGKHVWMFWSAVRRKLRAAHAAHIRSGGPRAGPAPLRQNPALGATWMLPVGLRHANRSQYCSANVIDDVPF
jgi:IS605 OrfB family transposase